MEDCFRRIDRRQKLAAALARRWTFVNAVAVLVDGCIIALQRFDHVRRVKIGGFAKHGRAFGFLA